MILEAKRVPKGRQFGRQNGAKIDQKSRYKFKSGQITSWSHLGSILARFPSRLGVKNIDFSLVFKAFRENQGFWRRLVSKSDSDPKMEQKGSQNGTNMAPKTDQNSIQKYDGFFDRFWSGLRATREPWLPLRKRQGGQIRGGPAPPKAYS